jgi:multidrug transporter EmrE-like cation transporter
MYWIALLAAIVANVVANFAFKKAMSSTPLEGGLSDYIKLATEPWMWLGGIMAMVLLGCYLYALKEIDLSIAYPAVTGLSFLGIVVVGVLTLNESMSPAKLLAIVLIVAGVLILKQYT